VKYSDQVEQNSASRVDSVARPELGTVHSKDVTSRHTSYAVAEGEDQTRRALVAFVSNSACLHMTEENLREAFPADKAIHFDLAVLKPNVSVLRLLDSAEVCGKVPDLIVHETGTLGLPRDLNTTPIPTACLDIDTFGWTSFRLRWAMLFDYVFTWHPSYVPLFQQAGHPKVFALPHAVDATLFDGNDAGGERPYDLAFVGNVGLAQYKRRDRIVSRLAARFKMNDFRHSYSKQEMAEVYKHAKIVVNVSREEYPQDANMRCYEAMAAGALLITGMPTELTEWGLQEGQHFVGWRNEDEIEDLVDHYRRHERERGEIARAGRKRTLKEFTYQHCWDTILGIVAEHGNQLFAPVRRWPPEEVHLLYLSYYYRFLSLSAALEEFNALRKISRRAYWKGLPMALRTLRRVVQNSML
jgi:hypothetical protein